MTGAHLVTENRHKYEIMVDGEAVLCEIWDTCPKVMERFLLRLEVCVVDFEELHKTIFF